jgi:hypothetical protein
MCSHVRTCEAERKKEHNKTKVKEKKNKEKDKARKRWALSVHEEAIKEESTFSKRQKKHGHLRRGP